MPMRVYRGHFVGGHIIDEGGVVQLPQKWAETVLSKEIDSASAEAWHPTFYLEIVCCLPSDFSISSDTIQDWALEKRCTGVAGRKE